MAKTLKEKPQKLIWVLNLTGSLPPSKISDAQKLSVFRLAIQAVLKDYIKGQEAVLDVFRKDFAKYSAQKEDLEKEKKSTKAIEEAIESLKEDLDEKIKEYVNDNDKEVTVTFDNEAFLYTEKLFSVSANHLFGQYQRGANGEIKEERFNVAANDELFSILSKAK